MKKNLDIVSIVFWIAIIFYLDPGGFRRTAMIGSIDGVKNTFLMFSHVAVAWFCLYLKYRKKENSIIKDKSLQSYTIVMLIWSFYFLLWFSALNNNTFSGFVRLIVRNERMIDQILIVYPIAYFASINLSQFIKILSWSTLIIMLMFIASVFFNLNLIDVAEGGRGMGLSVSRYFMPGYGIMWFTIPLTLSMLMMKFKSDRILMIAAFLAVIQIFLSILRRDIIGILEYSIIIAFIVNYVKKSRTINFVTRFLNIKSVSFVIIILVAMIIYAPDTVESFQYIAESTYRGVVLGEAEAGSTDETRMSLTAMTSTIKVIEENFLLGTGFLSEWGAEGSGGKGLEGSDYIFLSAFGMYGLIGLLIFLPFYFVVFRLIFRFVKLLRNNFALIEQHKAVLMFPVMVGIAASAEFVKNTIEYPMWFYPIGAVVDTPKYFIYFGLLVGSYYQIIKHIAFYKLKIYNE